MILHVNINTEKTEAWLNMISEKSMKYAISTALTRTAKQLREFLVSQEMPRLFTLRGNKRSAKGFRFEKATKFRLHATVYHLDDYMMKQEVKQGHSTLTDRDLPTRAIRKTPKTSLKGKGPQQLLATGEYRRVTLQRKGRLLDFIVKNVRRAGTSSTGKVGYVRYLKGLVAYILTPRSELDPRLDMAQAAQKVVDWTFEAELHKAISEELSRMHGFNFG